MLETGNPKLHEVGADAWTGVGASAGEQRHLEVPKVGSAEGAYIDHI